MYFIVFLYIKMLISYLNHVQIFFFKYLLPEIGTIQFYFVFCFYFFLLSLVVNHIIVYFNSLLIEDEEKEKGKTQQKLNEERRNRQKDAERILSKYFTVQSYDDYVKNDEKIS